MEPHDSFGQHGAEHATGTAPGLGALLDLQAQQLQALSVGLFPVLAPVQVVVVVPEEFSGDLGQRAFIEDLGDVFVEPAVFCLRHQVDFNAPCPQDNVLGVLDFNFDDGLSFGAQHGGGRQRPVKIRCHECFLAPRDAVGLRMILQRAGAACFLGTVQGSFFCRHGVTGATRFGEVPLVVHMTTRLQNF